MLDAVYCLARSYAVCIIGIGVTIKGFELSALFPSQSVTEVGELSSYFYYIIFK